MKDIVIVCAGTYGLEVLSVIDTINLHDQWAKREPSYRILGFIDDNPAALDGKGISIPIIGGIRDWQPVGDEVYKRGYSLESLRDLETVRLNSQESRDGYFFDDSIRHLFNSLSDGHNATLSGYYKSFRVRPIDSPLFNNKNLKHLADVRIAIRSRLAGPGPRRHDGPLPIHQHSPDGEPPTRQQTRLRRLPLPDPHPDLTHLAAPSTKDRVRLFCARFWIISQRTGRSPCGDRSPRGVRLHCRGIPAC